MADWGVIRDGCYAAVNAVFRFIHMAPKNVPLTMLGGRGNVGKVMTSLESASGFETESKDVGARWFY
jgi:hypothetical protein